MTMPHPGSTMPIVSSRRSATQVSQISVQRTQRKWQLVLWYGSRPTLQMSTRGEIRQWRLAANAFDFASKRYPQVSSYQLLVC